MENCVQQLPPTMFDFRDVHDPDSPQVPGPFRSDNGSVRMSMTRDSDEGVVEVEVDISLPPAVLVQSQCAVADWLLMQICL